MSVDRKQELIETAIDLFQEKGYHATSVQDIADRVGLQKGSLYHYISSKEDLLFEITHRSITSLNRELKDIVARDTSAVERLRAGIRALIVFTGTHIGTQTAFVRESHALGPKQRERIETAGNRYVDDIEALIKEGIEAGELRPVDTRVAVFTVLGACNWMFQWYDPEGRLDPDELADIMADIILEGLVTD